MFAPMLEHAWWRAEFDSGYDDQQLLVAHWLFHIRDVTGYEERGRRTILADIELRLARPSDDAGVLRRQGFRSP